MNSLLICNSPTLKGEGGAQRVRPLAGPMTGSGAGWGSSLLHRFSVCFVTLTRPALRVDLPLSGGGNTESAESAALSLYATGSPGPRRALSSVPSEG